MGADDHLVLPPAPQPEKTEPAPHPKRLRWDMAAIAISVLALGGTVWQACEARRAREAAEESATAAKALNGLTKDSLVIAQAAATAAAQSANAAEKQAQAALDQVGLSAKGNGLAMESLRARVTVRGVTLRQKPTAGQSLTADVTVENTGQSEAVNVRVRMNASMGRVLPLGDMPTIPAPPTASAAVLAPRSTMTSDLTIHATSVSAEVVEALKSGGTNLFVFGVVTYETFGASHQANFCFIPSPMEIQNAQTCSKWNSAR
jgi:hypothetical protein